LALPCSPGALRRSRNTSSQVGLNHDERWQNVHGAFEGDPKMVKGQRLLLVDDLYTTGATMRACQQALAGAEKVFGLTVARA
jgi:predicted amidophosphoribosyltransferase